jgi:hypothetical protein
LIILNLDERTGNFRIQISDRHAIRAKHSREGAGEGVTELASPLQGGFRLREFALMEKATTKDALDFGILRGHEEGIAGRFFGFGIAPGKVEGASLEFAGLWIVLIPPEGLAGGDEGAAVSAGWPSFES